VALIGAGLGAAYLYATLRLTTPIDGEVFLESARSWLAGGPLYSRWEGAPDIPNLNLPHTILLFVPFAALRIEWWQLANVAAFALALALVVRACGTPSSWWALVAVLLCPSVTVVQIGMAQIAGLLALGVTVGWLAVRGRHDTRGGLALGLVVACKPFLGLLFLPYLGRPRLLWLP
jgi:hypothetical protein